MILNLVLLTVFIAVTLMLTREGLWTGLVTLLNVLLAASVATAWYEVLANFLERHLPSYTYLLDSLSIWAIFSVVLLVLREVTDRTSRTKVKFLRQVEFFGAPAIAMIVGWLMVAFTAASLHTAAVPRDIVQPTPEKNLFFGLAPDRKWLQWVRNASRRGPFGSPDHPVDSDARFILRYADRRLKLEGEEALRVQSK